MWNDTDIPLGYLITFRCYGTWLHGDERGAIDRLHNRYKSPYLPRSDRRHKLSERSLNVRTNHVHVVASIGAIKPERALNQANAAWRQLESVTQSLG